MRDNIKKVGLYLGANYKGGALQYNQTMLDAVSTLPEKEFEKVICFSDEYWEKKVIEKGIKGHKIVSGYWGYHYNRLWRRFDLPLSIWRMICPFMHGFSKQLINRQCDIWIYPSQDSFSYEIPLPSIVTIYDLNHRYNNHFPEVSANGIYEKRERAYKAICKWSTGILVDSNIGKQQVIDCYGVGPSKIHVLPYVPPKYIFNKNVPKDFNERFKLPEKYIFYPAQFWEHKNHKNLILAIRKNLEKHPDINLVLSGSEKNAYEAVKQLVGSLGLAKKIFFLGYVPDEYMSELYRRARAMVMPTHFGPTNIPPLEAMATGCPVAVSNIYAMPEQLGEAALYFDPYSVDGIAEIIERLWVDDSLCARLAHLGFIKSKNWNQTHFNDRLNGILSIALS